MRLIVVAPTPYRPTKSSRLHYRDSAHLLTTDLKRDSIKLLQAYFDRWQIEVNFREEKDGLGLEDWALQLRREIGEDLNIVDKFRPREKENSNFYGIVA